ncbi:hypothetical protein ASPZODRAFT_158062 [Penicilliopsis zonata CBS 506.65]|uniref:Methyltransferase domain-containing protein n=1 Tax=Penicilliopsis zonata CBS 506.65 TaxID=1073090 RepID=A0A1L9SMQ6_9EURO|nr:hypothetical protein ASPZODRAFT_158062 [Penicilliopsis zonata CBS 506.65]OJJ48317.1 hypothetical protein ASPZODRAFT_158062 [Penicilliopsis zonata CBS 506.65]
MITGPREGGGGGGEQQSVAAGPKETSPTPAISPAPPDELAREYGINTEVPEPTDFPDLHDGDDDDGGIESDGDSVFDENSINSETTSLNSSVIKYREEIGRRYHAYGTMEHWGPNDEHAQEQQDLSHHLWTLVLNGNLYLAPIRDPKSVLDLGTGTGIWAIDMADAHPQAVVKGIDLSPIQPSWIPPNLKFEIDDYNLEWLDKGKYDLIHGRELLGTVPNWVEFYRQVLSGLKPGGWFEQVDPTIFLVSNYGTLPPGHVFHQWSELMDEGGRKAGLDFNTAHHIKRWLEEVGFVNVTEVKMPIPVGSWPKDPRQREIGAFNQLRIEQGVLDFCGRRFTNNLGWSRVQLEVFCAAMRDAVRDSKLLAHHYAYFVYGQKPGNLGNE